MDFWCISCVFGCNRFFCHVPDCDTVLLEFKDRPSKQYEVNERGFSCDDIILWRTMFKMRIHKLVVLNSSGLLGRSVFVKNTRDGSGNDQRILAQLGGATGEIFRE